MTYCDMPPEFYEWTEPTARRVHMCCECLAPINQGEKHFKASGKWAEVVSTYRQHLLCMEACMYVRDKMNDGECICFGELKEWFDEDRLYYVKNENAEIMALRAMVARILWRERPFRKRRKVVTYGIDL